MIQVKILICEVCGKLLTYQKKYCSNSCSAKGKARKQRKGHSEETKRKIREANLGKKRSDEARKRMSDAQKGNANALGHVKSDETKQQISNSMKNYYENTPEARSEMSLLKKEQYKTHPEILDKMSESMKLVYKDYEFDPERSMSSYRRLAIETYGYQCALCGETSTRIRMDAHHIDGNHDNNDIDNLCVLCCSCHSAIHPNTLRGDNTPDPIKTRLILESRHQIESSNTEMEESNYEN